MGCGGRVRPGRAADLQYYWSVACGAAGQPFIRTNTPAPRDPSGSDLRGRSAAIAPPTMPARAPAIGPSTIMNTAMTEKYVSTTPQAAPAIAPANSP